MDKIMELAKAIRTSSDDKSKTAAYDTTAEVISIENGTAWVHIPGGVDRTPAKLVVDAKKGDSVRVRVSGGKAYVTGNATAPPTDDTKANKADAKATEAKTKADEAMSGAVRARAQADNAYEIADSASGMASDASKTANSAYKIADSTNQYFWFRGEGDDTGAHITEIPQSEWNDEDSENYHSGGNLLARSNGIAVRDGLTELATFGATGAQIGKSGNAQLSLTDSVLNFKYQNTNVFRMGMSTLPNLEGFIGVGSATNAETRYSASDSTSGVSMRASGNESVLSTPYGYVSASRSTSEGGSVMRAGDGTQYNYASVEVNSALDYSPEILLDLYKGTTSSNLRRTYLNISDGVISLNAANVGISLNTSASSGTDHDLYTAITALGWQSTVIV